MRSATHRGTIVDSIRCQRILAKSHLCLGLTYLREGEMQKSITSAEEGLRLTQAHFNRELDEAIASYVVGIIMQGNGHVAQAREHFTYFLERTGALGFEERHPYVFTALHAAGVACSDEKKYDEAMTYFHRSIQAKETVLGREHPDVARTLFCIGQILHEQDALAHYKKSLHIQSVVHNGRNLEVLRTMRHVGHVLHFRSELQEAFGMHRHALVMEKEILGETHPLGAFILKMLANICLEMGHEDNANAYLLDYHACRELLPANMIPEDVSLVVALRLSINKRRSPDAAAA